MANLLFITNCLILDLNINCQFLPLTIMKNTLIFILLLYIYFTNLNIILCESERCQESQIHALKTFKRFQGRQASTFESCRDICHNDEDCEHFRFKVKYLTEQQTLMHEHYFRSQISPGVQTLTPDYSKLRRPYKFQRTNINKLLLYILVGACPCQPKEFGSQNKSCEEFCSG